MTRDTMRDARRRLLAEFGTDENGNQVAQKSPDGQPLQHTERQDRTAIQRIIEQEEGMDILDVIKVYRPADLARKYGLHRSTITWWKKRLGR